MTRAGVGRGGGGGGGSGGQRAGEGAGIDPSFPPVLEEDTLPARPPERSVLGAGQCCLCYDAFIAQSAIVHLLWTRDSVNSGDAGIEIRRGPHQGGCGDPAVQSSRRHRVVGLIPWIALWLRHPSRERKIPGSNPTCDGIFFRVESYQ